MKAELLIFIGLILLLTAALVGRSLATGRRGFGSYAISRGEHRIGFRFMVGLAVVAVPLAMAALYADALTGDHWPAVTIIGIPPAAFWLVRLLEKGASGSAWTITAAPRRRASIGRWWRAAR